MLTWSWVVEVFDRKSGEFVNRLPLNDFTDSDALALLAVTELTPADLFDLSNRALVTLSERYQIEFYPEEFDYVLGREAH